MNTLGVIAVFLITLYSPAKCQILRLSLGQSCGLGKRCMSSEECSKIQDIALTRPQICSFQRNEAILCCNETIVPSIVSNSNSKAKAICKEYTRINCQRRPVGPVRIRRSPNMVVVVGGYEAEQFSHPHMAAVGYGSNDSVQWLCGGSIISERFILSAAHCAQSPTGLEAQYIRVGQLTLPTKFEELFGFDFLITKRIVHPDYSPATYYNDIALFQVNNNLLALKQVKPICLSTGDNINTGMATAAGWGKTDFAGASSSTLMAVELGVVDSDKCKRQLGRSRGIPDGVNEVIMICAGEEKGGKDTCGGDSGGPLFFNRSSTCLKEQIGIVSFGRLCALPNTPAVYTRVSAFVPWIESIVWS